MYILSQYLCGTTHAPPMTFLGLFFVMFCFGQIYFLFQYVCGITHASPMIFLGFSFCYVFSCSLLVGRASGGGDSYVVWYIRKFQL